MAKKIVLIENQIRQFDVIRGHLVDSIEAYAVYPDENTYKNFIDHVRVYLNKRYGTVRIDGAKDGMLAQIKRAEPDLLIIDHILVGNHSSENGLNLAKMLRANNFKQPIIFLSRTLQNHVDVCRDFPLIMPPAIWVSKGYSGEEILEEKYFKNEVLQKIHLMLDTPQPNAPDEFWTSAVAELRDSLKTFIDSSSRYPRASYDNSISISEQVITAVTEIMDSQGRIPEQAREAYNQLNNMLVDGDFGEKRWDLACQQLLDLLK